MTTFTCYECEEEYPLSELSEYSLKLARTKCRTQALRGLLKSQIVCQGCADSSEFDDLFENWDDEVPSRQEIARDLMRNRGFDQALADRENLNY
jgi:hypothetical protein